MPTSSPQPSSTPDAGAASLVADINALIAQTEALLAESTSQHAVAKLDLMRDGELEKQVAEWNLQFRQATDRLAKNLERADRLARAYPYQASVLALIAGVIAGRLLVRD